MLETCAIPPSQSAWCNAIVLVRKKDEVYNSVLTSTTWTHVCKRTPIPLPRDSGGVGESGRCWTFFVPRPQIRVLANKNGGGIETIYCLHCRQFGFFQMWPHALLAVQCTGHISEADAKLSQQVKSHLLPHLLRWHSHTLMDSRGTSPQAACGLWPVQGV